MAQTSSSESAAFKAAVDAAVEERVGAAVEDALRRFAAAAPASAPVTNGQSAADGSAVVLADRLSVQLAKLTGQGIGQNYVDPEIIARQKSATIEMRELIDELRGRNDEPQWKLVGQIHIKLGNLGFALVEPFYRDAAKKRAQTEIGSYAIPNLAMRPLNPAAEKVWRLFTASIGRSEVGDEETEEWELTQAGATIRKGVRPPRDATDGALEADGVRIIRGDDPGKRKVQVFTGMPAIEMAEHT